MLQELTSKLNWLDVVVVLIFIRIIYIGLKQGLVTEIFKLTGIIFAVFICLHYYSKIAELLSSNTPIPLELSDLISFVVLIVAGVLIFKLIRDGFDTLFKTEVLPFINKILGFILSIYRGLITCSIILILLLLSNVYYFKKSVVKSFSKGYILNLAPNTYSFWLENVLTKFFPNEDLDKTIFETIEDAEEMQ